MPNLLRNQSVIFFATVYEISKSVIPLSNSVSKNLVIGPWALVELFHTELECEINIDGTTTIWSISKKVYFSID